MKPINVGNYIDLQRKCATNSAYEDSIVADVNYLVYITVSGRIGAWWSSHLRFMSRSRIYL